MKMKTKQRKINEIKSWFFEKIDEINKCLAIIGEDIIYHYQE